MNLFKWLAARRRKKTQKAKKTLPNKLPGYLRENGRYFDQQELTTGQRLRLHRIMQRRGLR